MLGSMSGWVLASEEAALDTGQEEPSSELAVVSEEFPLDNKIPEEAVTDGEPDELDTASEFGTWTDPETGEEYEILSSVEDILPGKFTEDEITEGLLEIMEEITEDIPEETPEEQEAEATPGPEPIPELEPEINPEPEPVATPQPEPEVTPELEESPAIEPEPEEIPEEESQSEPLEEIEEEPSDEPAVEIPEEIAALDFSSQRILVSNAGADMVDSATVLASYEDVALLQFDSEQDAMEAYAHYSETDAAVEVDAIVVAADDVTAIEDTYTAPAVMDETDNPLTALNEILEDTAPPASNGSLKLIAVIDTGATGGGNVLERYSVLGGDVDDDNGHGNAMIGHITGIDPDATIISIKALDAYGHGSMSSLYAAVKLAIELDVDIISLSVYANKTDDSAIVVGAIEDAVNAGITVIGAAGNSGSNAAYYVPGCVSGAVIAGSLSQEHTIQPFSNYGSTVDYYVQSASTSEAAAKLTGYYSLTKANFEDIDCESVFRIAYEGVSDYSALDTDDFVVAWSGWPITLTQVTDTPVGIVSGSKIYFAVGGFNTHNFYAMYDGYVSDFTTAAAAPAYAYCLDATDTSTSYNAAYVYELDISRYPVLAAAVITAPGARAKNDAASILSGVNLDTIWAPLNNSCFDWLDDDGNAHALLCYLFHGTWDFEPMNWPTSVINQQKAALEQIAASLENTFKPGTQAYSTLCSRFRVFVVASAQSSSSYQRFIFSISEDETSGGIKIIKTSDDGNVGGITFTVKNNDTGTTQTVTTKENGEIELDEMPAGSYTVTETVPAEYVAEAKSQTVTVKDGETAEVTFKNSLKKFRVTVTKVDAKTGVPQADASLKDAVYGLYHNGTEIARYTTDKNGQFTTDYYACGTGWTIKEITPSPGYTLDTTVHTIDAAPGTFTVTRNTVEMEVKENPITGQVEVFKKATNSVTGEKQYENGAMFEVYLKSAGSYANADESERDILTTNNKGYAISKKLPYGVYVIHQTSGWEGHIIDDVLYDMNIDTNGKVVPIELDNEVFKGTFKVVKVDKYTTTPLAGATFQIKDSSGAVIAEETTDDDGIITVENLVYGSYTYQETVAPEGYQLDEKLYYFSIDLDGQTVEHTREDLRIPGSISVLKTDNSGKSLSGVIYLLEYSTNNGRSWSPVTSRTGDNITAGGCTSAGLSDGKLITGGDGKAKFEGLLADKKIMYRLTEVATQNGHTLLKDPVYTGTLPVDGDSDPIYDISATIKEGSVFGLPMTGSNGFSPWLFAMAALLFISASLTVYATIQRQRLLRRRRYN